MAHERRTTDQAQAEVCGAAHARVIGALALCVGIVLLYHMLHELPSSLGPK